MCSRPTSTMLRSLLRNPLRIFLLDSCGTMAHSPKWTLHQNRPPCQNLGLPAISNPDAFCRCGLKVMRYPNSSMLYAMEPHGAGNLDHMPPGPISRAPSEPALSTVPIDCGNGPPSVSGLESSSSSSGGGGGGGRNASLLGLAALVGVSLLWGSYSPALKLIFTSTASGWVQIESLNIGYWYLCSSSGDEKGVLRLIFRA